MESSPQPIYRVDVVLVKLLITEAVVGVMLRSFLSPLSLCLFLSLFVATLVLP